MAPPAEQAALEARVAYLERLSRQLEEQVRVMKQLVTAEVADVKEAAQLQIAEVKQVVMQQDRVYQDRIQRLEARIEQLSDFALQVARSNGGAGPGFPYAGGAAAAAAGAVAAGGVAGHVDPAVARAIPPDFYAPPPADDGTGAAALAARGASPAGGDGSDDEAEAPLGGIEGVVAKYRQKLEGIYDLYTTSSIQVFHPAMAMSHFVRLVRDCGLSAFDSGTPAELLWMAVIRKLGHRIRRSRKKAAAAAVLATGRMSTARMERPKASASFAHERLDEIPKAAFGEAMFYLAVEKAGRDRVALPAEALLETFLLSTLFPATDGRYEELRAARERQALVTASVAPAGAAGGADGTGLGATAGSTGAADPAAAYKTAEVKEALRPFLARLRDAFHAAIHTAQSPHEHVMTLDGFVELVRRHGLMNVLSKPDIRQIFVICSDVEAAKNPEAPPGSITMPGFMLAVHHLADRIYGDPMVSDKFPTAESRARKLMAKMFLIR